MRSFFPHDWFVLADHDEFHVYPDDLQAMVAHCEREGYDAVTGNVVDRVARDGSLPDLLPGESLWETFPLACQLTRVVIDDPCPEVVLAKGRVAIGWGNHVVPQGAPCPASQVHVSVHHFKWDAGVIARLE